MKTLKIDTLESISGGLAIPCIVVGGLAAAYGGIFGPITGVVLGSEIKRCWDS